MAFINNTYQVSGNVYIQSGVAWTGTGSVTGALTGSFAITNTPNVQPLIGSIYGIGIGSLYAQVVGSVNINGTPNVTSNGQNIATETTLAKLALTQGNGTAGQNGALVQSAVGSVAPSYTHGNTNPFSLNLAGQLRTETIFSGTNFFTGSVSIAGTPPPNAPGSIYGIGIGSVYAQVLGSIQVVNTVTTQPLIGSIYGIGVGSVYATVGNTVTTQPLIGSLYGIGVGSMYVQIGAPATIGSIATQGIIGSVQVTNASILTQGFVGQAQTATGSPFLAGFVGKTAYPTAVTDGQVTYGLSDKAGRQIAVLHGMRDIITQPGSDAVLTASGTAVLVLQSGGTSIFNDITTIQITNGGSVATMVNLLSSGVAYRQFQIAANGGIATSFTTPMKQPQANAAWTAALDTAVNRDVRVWVQTVNNQ